jgi:hypothetical protein
MAESKKNDRSAWWLAVAGVVGAIAGSSLTGIVSYETSKGETDDKMIKLSVQILQAAHTPENKPLREWAIRVMQDRGKYPFSAEQQAALLDQGTR